MRTIRTITFLLIGGIALIGLSGCEQVEQAANDAVEKAKQSAVQALDEAKQTGSIDEARQSATQALQEAKQAAAGILGQASDYLANDQQAQDGGDAPETSPDRSL